MGISHLKRSSVPLRIIVPGEDAKQSLAKHLDTLMVYLRLAMLLEGIVAGFNLQAPGHAGGIVQSPLERGEGQQTRIAGQLPLVPRDNDGQIGEKIELNLFCILRRPTRPRCLDSTVSSKTN